MTQQAAALPKQGTTPDREYTGLLASNTYNIFVLVMTIYSLAIMVVQVLLKEGTETYALVNLYNNLICIFFLFDFAMHIRQSRPWTRYFFRERGYFDLLGSIPSFGFSQYTALLRVFRVFRLTRLRRFMNPENRALLKTEILNNRGQYALFLTLLLVILVLMTASVTVLFFESKSPDANITTGGDALWWAIVTITTVGYGDKYPVTPGGRVTAVFVMFSGVGIIGALASILASILVPQPKPDEPEPDKSAPPASNVEQELIAVKGELASLRQLLERRESG